MSDESDIELHGKAMPKRRLIKSKIPKSPIQETLAPETAAKITTKIMVVKALEFLDTRKGVSLYAIKKYMEGNYQVNTEKINYHIKKYIKNSIEKGTIVKTKGIGASGSFRLAPKKNKKVAEKKISKPVKEKKEKSDEKLMKVKLTKKKVETKDIEKKSKSKTTKSKEKPVKKETKKPKTTKTKKNEVSQTEKGREEKAPAKKKKKKTVEIRLPMTPALKKKILTKRKSIGSIIKPPKMKPKPTKTTKTKPTS